MCGIVVSYALHICYICVTMTDNDINRAITHKVVVCIFVSIRRKERNTMFKRITAVLSPREIFAEEERQKRADARKKYVAHEEGRPEADIKMPLNIFIR